MRVIKHPTDPHLYWSLKAGRWVFDNYDLFVADEVDNITPPENGIWDRPPIRNPQMAVEACTRLVEAYCYDPQYVDWSDVQNALEAALEALGLPSDYPEQVHERLIEEEM